MPDTDQIAVFILQVRTYSGLPSNISTMNGTHLIPEDF